MTVPYTIPQAILPKLILVTTYFGDAGKERIDPLSLNQTTWEDVKKNDVPDRCRIG